MPLALAQHVSARKAPILLKWSSAGKGSASGMPSLGAAAAAELRRSATQMKDIVYFGAEISESSNELAGKQIAQVLHHHFQSQGFSVTDIKKHWDAFWLFRCNLSKTTFAIEVTPYYEATPLEYSIQFRHEPGFLSRIFFSRALPQSDTIRQEIDRILHENPQFHAVKWKSIEEIEGSARKQRRNPYEMIQLLFIIGLLAIFIALIVYLI
jgi:hypothetical protein